MIVGSKDNPASQFATDEEDEMIEDIHICACIAKTQDHNHDNPTYKDIMRRFASEREQWDEAILGSFEIVSRSRGTNILQSTWALKQKRLPDGSLKKYKARFCEIYDQQVEGLDVLDTYTPVVTWIIVQFLRVISLVSNLATQQVDYTNTFYQEKIEQTLFVELLSGLEVPNKVLLLKQSVYGMG